MTAALDQAYELLREKGPEYGPLGLSNHGPMAAEALHAAGRDDAILPWLERYGRLLDPQPPGFEPIDPLDWQSAIGRLDRFADWLGLFEQELAEPQWQPVLERWSSRLAPGLSGGALHGLLRTAHATRALSASDTRLRRFELAQGLAYWAACFYRLPGDPAAGRLPTPAALAAVPLLPVDQRPELGLITTSLENLAVFAPFRTVATNLDYESLPAEQVVSDLTLAFAGAYLSNVTPTNRIALIHMLTGPSSVRLLLPHTSESTGRTLVAYSWQAGAALFSAFATDKQQPVVCSEPPAADDLLDRALLVGDEHAIKFTEACLREEAVQPSPIFRAAADDVVRHMASD